mmetsp:Transcript_46690/g.123309  ORF Transcript_46690/g.123309 Transcript_46690/m.123309 type:complete len:267 (-) Transcript_46690:47-847(-)
MLPPGALLDLGLALLLLRVHHVARAPRRVDLRRGGAHAGHRLVQSVDDGDDVHEGAGVEVLGGLAQLHHQAHDRALSGLRGGEGDAHELQRRSHAVAEDLPLLVHHLLGRQHRVLRHRREQPLRGHHELGVVEAAVECARLRPHPDHLEEGEVLDAVLPRDRHRQPAGELVDRIDDELVGAVEAGGPLPSVVLHPYLGRPVVVHLQRREVEAGAYRPHLVDPQDRVLEGLERGEVVQRDQEPHGGLPIPLLAGHGDSGGIDERDQP